MAKVEWDQSEDAASTGFEVLPKGRYLTRIEGSEKTDTKNKDGYYFAFEFVITRGDFKNRKLWCNLNVSNPSEAAQRIGREQFKALCVAAKKPDGVKKTEELHGKYVVCFVDIEPASGGYREKNRINGFALPQAEGTGSSEDEPGKAAPAGKPGKPPPGKKDDDFDDDIPF